MTYKLKLKYENIEYLAVFMFDVLCLNTYLGIGKGYN